MTVKTGYEIREGSRMIAERIERAQQLARMQRLAVIKQNLHVAVKAIDEEIKAA